MNILCLIDGCFKRSCGMLYWLAFSGWTCVKGFWCTKSVDFSGFYSPFWETFTMLSTTEQQQLKPSQSERGRPPSRLSTSNTNVSGIKNEKHLGEKTWMGLAVSDHFAPFSICSTSMRDHHRPVRGKLYKLLHSSMSLQLNVSGPVSSGH